ncbi:MAG: hypothetical protein WC310_00380 [Patescibacteria group bacterium]|jgi:hypothetical protein
MTIKTKFILLVLVFLAILGVVGIIWFFKVELNRETVSMLLGYLDF